MDLSHSFMETLKHLGRVVVNLIKQAWLLPRSFESAAKRRRLQAVLNEREAERLDRIRNPSKYVGK